MRSIEVPAGVIDYDEAGSGPPVVLLHGLLMDHTVWDRVLPLLPAGFCGRQTTRSCLPRRSPARGADTTGKVRGDPGRVRAVHAR
jgi:pimeloyl-ACP methyl ester carboxylesterase